MYNVFRIKRDPNVDRTIWGASNSRPCRPCTSKLPDFARAAQPPEESRGMWHVPGSFRQEGRNTGRKKHRDTGMQEGMKVGRTEGRRGMG